MAASLAACGSDKPAPAGEPSSLAIGNLEAGATTVPRGGGIIHNEGLGLTLEYPSEWEGIDRVDTGVDADLPGSKDWTVYSFLRWEGAPSPAGDSPSIAVRVITSESKSGNDGIEAYFQQLSSLASNNGKLTYEAGIGTKMKLASAAGENSEALILDAEPPDKSGDAQLWLRSRYELRDGRLYVVSYFRNSPGELRLDYPLVRDIFASVAID